MSLNSETRRFIWTGVLMGFQRLSRVGLLFLYSARPATRFSGFGLLLPQNKQRVFFIDLWYIYDVMSSLQINENVSPNWFTSFIILLILLRGGVSSLIKGKPLFPWTSSSELAIYIFLPTTFSNYLLPTPRDEILGMTHHMRFWESRNAKNGGESAVTTVNRTRCIYVFGSDRV